MPGVVRLSFMRYASQTVGYIGEPVDHPAELCGAYPDDFHVIQRRHREFMDSALQKTHFAEKAAFTLIGEHQLAAGVFLRHFHEPDANEEEVVRRLALATKNLAPGIANQLDFLGQFVYELRTQGGEEGYGPKMILESPLAII